MSLYDIIQNILDVSKNHNLVREVGEGDIYNYLNSSEHQYPCVFLTVSSINDDLNLRNVNCTLFYVDRLTSDESNKILVQSLGLSVLSDIVERIAGDVDTVEYTTFTEKFTDLCGGVYASLSIGYPLDGACSNDFEVRELKITENGIYDVLGYDSIIVSVINDDSEQRIEQLEEELLDKNIQLNNLQIQVDEKTSQIQTLQAENANLQQQIENKEGNISELEAQIEENNSLIESLHQDVDNLNQQIVDIQASFEKQIQFYTQEVDRLNYEVGQKDGEIENLNQIIEQKDIIIDSNDEVVTGLEAQINSVKPLIITQNGTYIPEEGVLGWNKVDAVVVGNEEELENLQAELESKLVEINNLQITVNEKNTQIQTLEAEIATLNQRIEDKDGDISELQSQIESKEQEISMLRSMVREANDTITDLNAQITTLNQSISQLESTINTKDDEIENLNNTISNKDTQIEGLNNTITSKDNTISGLNNTIDLKNQQITNLNQSINEKDEQIEGLEINVVSLNAIIVEKDTQIDGLEDEVENLNSTIVEKDEEISGLNTQINSVGKLNITKNGTYLPKEGVLGWNNVTVNVEGSGYNVEIEYADDNSKVDFYIESLYDNNKIDFRKIIGSGVLQSRNAFIGTVLSKLEYKINDGVYTSMSSIETLTINTGDRIYIRCSDGTWWRNEITNILSNYKGLFAAGSSVKIGGNVSSLLGVDGTGNDYRNLFGNFASLNTEGGIINRADIHFNNIGPANYCFGQCNRMKDISISGISNITDFTDIFKECQYLTNVKFDVGGAINSSISFEDCKDLTYQSTMNILNACYNTNNNNAKTVTFPNIAIINDQAALKLIADCETKGWIVNGIITKVGSVTLTAKNIDSSSYSKTVTATDTVFNKVTVNVESVGVKDGMKFAYSTISAFNNSKPYYTTKKITDFSKFFYYCKSLTNVTNLDLSAGTNFTDMFAGCEAVTGITVEGSINYSIKFNYCTKLDFNSVKSILTACSNTTNTNTKTVTFNCTVTDNSDGVLAELKSTCNSKGWTISGLTIN